jgi:hypothetical protein
LKNTVLLVTLLTISFQGFSQDPDPILYQTWYLVAQHSDLGPSSHFTPSTSRQIIINPDLSFIATDNCATRTGIFIYTEDSEYNYIRPVDHIIDTSGCSNGDVYESFWELEEEYDLWMQVYNSGDNDFFSFEGAPGFGNDFANQLLSIEEQLLNSIIIYPNPTTNILKIEDKSQVIESYSILDVIGKTVVKTTTFNGQDIALTSLTSGVYFIKVVSEAGSNILKFIKD